MSRKNTAVQSEAGVAFSVRMRDYNSIAVQVDLDGGTNVVTFETSNDNATWINAMGISPASAEQDPAATLSADGLMVFPKTGEYFRARVSTYDAGDIAFSYVLSKAPIVANSLPAGS